MLITQTSKLTIPEYICYVYVCIVCKPKNQSLSVTLLIMLACMRRRSVSFFDCCVVFHLFQDVAWVWLKDSRQQGKNRTNRNISANHWTTNKYISEYNTSYIRITLTSRMHGRNPQINVKPNLISSSWCWASRLVYNRCCLWQHWLSICLEDSTSWIPFPVGCEIYSWHSLMLRLQTSSMYYLPYELMHTGSHDVWLNISIF